MTNKQNEMIARILESFGYDTEHVIQPDLSERFWIKNVVGCANGNVHLALARMERRKGKLNNLGLYTWRIDENGIVLNK